MNTKCDTPGLMGFANLKTGTALVLTIKNYSEKVVKGFVLGSLVLTGIVSLPFNYAQAASLNGVNINSTQHQKSIKSMDEGEGSPIGPGGGEMGGIGGAGGGFGYGNIGVGGGRAPEPCKPKKGEKKHH